MAVFGMLSFGLQDLVNSFESGAWGLAYPALWLILACCCAMDVVIFIQSNRIDNCVDIYLVMYVIWNYLLAQTAPRVPKESLEDLSSSSL